MRLLPVLLAVLCLAGAVPPATAGDLPFHRLSLGYSSRIGLIYGLGRTDSLAWAEVRTGVVFGGYDQAAFQIGLCRRILPDVTAMVAISEPLVGVSPRALSHFSRQYHGDIFWKDLFGLSLDGKGESRQLSLNIWRVAIPIAGHIEGVPWVLR